MEWDQQLVDGLDRAFNESQVCGLSFDADNAEARVLLEVLALPDLGLLDPRRVVVFSGVSALDVTLERDLIHPPRPVLPVESLAAVEALFAGLTFAHSMYGWSFIDADFTDEEPTGAPSLVLRSNLPDAAHTFRWFTECGRLVSEEDSHSYVLSGVVRFARLRVERADGQEMSLADFCAYAQRWWDAFFGRDARLSGGAQQQVNLTALTWRPWGSSATLVPGKPS